MFQERKDREGGEGWGRDGETRDDVLVIVLPDDGLHRFGAGHGRLAAHEPGAGAEGEGECLAERVEEGRPDMVLGAEEGGRGEVVALGLPHFL